MPGTQSTSQTTSPDPWPPASMGELITMCSSPALIGLGIVPAPGQDEPEVDLHLARHFIDLLALLAEKTANQLDEAEQKGLEQSLHELRMAFVQVQQATLEQTDTPADPPQEDPPEDEEQAEEQVETEDDAESDSDESLETQDPDDPQPEPDSAEDA